MRSRKSARPLGAAAVILVAAITSCSATGSGAETSVACDAPGVTPDQVTLGFVVSDTGPNSEAFSSARAGLDAGLGLANAEGGVHGRKIVYEWRDDANSAPQNARATEELVQHESVFGLVTATSALGGSMDNLTASGVPVVGVAAEPAWAEHSNMFSNLYASSPETVAQYARASGGTKVAFLTSGDATFTLELVQHYVTALQALNFAIAGTIPYTNNSDSPDRVARQIAESGADVLIGVTTPTDFAAVMQATRAAGASFAASISLSGYDQRVLPPFGSALAGVSMPVFFRPFEAGGPAIERYRDAMSRYAPQTVPPEQQFAMFTYIYADMVVRGLDIAGPCPTREGFIDALRNVASYDAGGLIEPTDLRTNMGQPIKCHAFVQVNPTGTAFEVSRERICADGTGA